MGVGEIYCICCCALRCMGMAMALRPRWQSLNVQAHVDVHGAVSGICALDSTYMRCAQVSSFRILDHCIHTQRSLPTETMRCRRALVCFVAYCGEAQLKWQPHARKLKP
ncbi:hypothetical protein L227DRAFT_94451 [Lentinus tigrinus ALCF2SS1-6]|uniref:Uncharacterized protein n=1 Tax=Lentinus tigrinus ALCF2SS1-6 TaxID=1328759 RepID=A0A5C2SA13_9APHY|nr:hypothetical protein L227DRAFT_94451 [Lentinus tigrinus ALCF2SS1-6]